MTAVLFSVLFFGVVLADPQVFWLKSYSTNNQNNVVNVESGGRLYLASNDGPAQLRKIKIQSGNNAYTLDQLLTGNGIKLQSNQLSITSSIDPPTAATITGFLYSTSAAQANDNTFEVTVVNGPQDINKNAAQTTLVILNTQFVSPFPPFDAPDKTTYVTNVKQDRNTALNFHSGYPATNYATFTDNQFFENPQYTPNYDNWGKIYNQTSVFFDSVEPIQVNLPYWYVSANGPFSMRLDSTYDDSHIHNTTNAMTTGVFVLTDVWEAHSVNFMIDPTRKGNTGVLVTTELQYSVNVTFRSEDSTSYQLYGAENGIIHGQILTNMRSRTLQITPTAIYPGTMYLQYFVYPGDLLPTTESSSTQTTTPSVTTTTVYTTTKSSGSLNVLFTMLVLCCTFWNYQKSSFIMF